jgi:hypothetical protein
MGMWAAEIRRMVIGLPSLLAASPLKTVSVAKGLEIFLPYPASAFIRMSAFCPTPESVEDSSVYTVVSLAAAYVLVVVRPALVSS